MTPLLPQNYYHTNFQTLICFVADHYWALLSAKEQQFFETFQRVDPAAQKLYIRLLTRKRKVFRRMKLHYAEIPSLEAAARELASNQLLLINPALPLPELLPLFTKAELVTLSGLPELQTLKRATLEQTLMAVDDPELLIRRLVQDEVIYQLLMDDCFKTFKLCFFGNLVQDMTDYVLRDLGLYKYEAYLLDHAHLPFNSREQIEQHLQYYACLDELAATPIDDSAALLNLATKLPNAPPDDAVLSRRVDRCKLTLARQLERLQLWQAAEQLYQDCRRHPARERRARIALKQGAVDAGLSLCREILTQAYCEEEKVFAADFAYRMAKKYRPENLQAWPAPDRYQPTKTLAVLAPGEKCVESQAAAWLSAQGDCYFVENCLFNGMMGLYLWDIIFAPVKGAFFNPFQSAPADFYSPEFLRQRQVLLQDRMHSLTAQHLQEIVWQHWQSKQQIANPLVHWQALSAELLTHALERIPLRHWRLIFDRLLTDLRNHRSGLPDLILFPHQGGYELVEVKGPGDKLQKNQLRWLSYFAEHAMPHRVLHIEYQDC